MSAQRQMVTLHPSHSLSILSTLVINIDHTDPAMLRETLESLVTALRGTLNLDLSRYRIRVRDISRKGAPSTVRCWCGVTAAGRTQVRR